MNHKKAFGAPDVKWDFEEFPWPWDDDSAEEVFANHVFEHLGESSAVFLRIMQELYRVCKDGAVVFISAPHPRHDDFINDPTHVRAVTHPSMMLFSKEFNRLCAEKGDPSTPLGLYLDVDFQVVKAEYMIDEGFKFLTKEGYPEERRREFIAKHNNVVKEVHIWMKVIKGREE